LPVLVIVTFWVAEEVPVVTFPKLKLVGLMPNLRVAAISVPARATEVGEVGALLTIEMLPDVAPTAVGWKATVIVVCCPALRFRGSENPLTVKDADPVSLTWVMLSVAVPVFLTIKTWDSLVPTTALPKLKDVGFTWIAGAGAGFTVSVAGALVIVPAVFVNTTANVDPLSAVVVTGVVQLAEVAPAMFTPFFCHW
jgi:hypothetical protein